jgi:predicted RNA-binding protein YlqC (UPF0109 family)
MEKDLIEYIAQNLANDRNAVHVNQRRAGQNTIIELKVASDDMGRVIGRQGRVANAMRTLLKASSNRRGRVILEID